jgi:hypoxanthine-guanine phosphoribosyltransferase
VDRLRVLITREQIAAKVAQMGECITADFAGETVVLIGVLKGATIFLADLARKSNSTPPSISSPYRATAMPSSKAGK